MAFVRPNKNALDDVVTAFQEKITTLQQLVVVSGVATDSMQLEDIEESISALEVCVQEVKQNIKSDQDFVTNARKLIQKMEAQQKTVAVLEDNIPTHLQATRKSSSALQDTTNAPKERDVPEKRPSTSHKRSSSSTKLSSANIHLAVPTPADLENTPKYVRGRLTYEKLQQVCADLDKTLKSKYKILGMQTVKMSDATLTKYKLFKEGECNETDGRYFVSTPELKIYGVKYDATFKAALGVLKHNNVLYTESIKGLHRFVIS